MVDVSAKADTEREAIARGEVLMQPETLAMIREGRMAKGDVLAVAQVAGIMGAKKTSDIIPMCHPLPLTGVTLDFELDSDHNRVSDQRHRPHRGQNRRRDGSVDGGVDCRAHYLRHVQSR